MYVHCGDIYILYLHTMFHCFRVAFVKDLGIRKIYQYWSTE